MTHRYISALNKLYFGILPHHRANASQVPQFGANATEAQQRAISLAFRRCRPLSCVRRSVLIGAHACSTLLKTPPAEGYSPTKRIAQVPFVASQIVEPQPLSPVVHMLEALPPEEASFYSTEASVLMPSGVCPALLADLERQYGFLGGGRSEWVQYLNRTDIPEAMWTFLEEQEVKARAGVSAVPKKLGGTLRKLVMAVPANYLFRDPKTRANHGMGGTSAVRRMALTGPSLQVAALDESHAFTSVVTPSWMWAYFACPPVKASEVWWRLSS